MSFSPGSGISFTLAALLALATSLAPARAQGFAGLGVDAGGFAEVVRGKALRFPADHGAHPEFRIEWWYLTANLKGADGRNYGVQWTLFRQAMAPGDGGEGWDSRQLWMGHAAVTDATTHRYAERFARGGVGQAGVTAAPFAAFIDNWQMQSASAATPMPASSPARSAVVASAGLTFAPLRLTAAAPNFSYALALDGHSPPVLQGEAGYSRKSERDQASYYYSQPDLTVSGAITLDGRAIEVTGQAWFDHEWSSQPLASDQTGWDWFALHLASGDHLMLFRLRHADGAYFFAGTWIDADGHVEPLEPGDIAMAPSASTAVAGHQLPTAWTISIASRGLAITTAPLNPKSWMDARFKYWEGPITVHGSVDGVGYLELTGY